MLVVVDIQCLLHFFGKCMAYSLFVVFQCVITGTHPAHVELGLDLKI